MWHEWTQTCQRCILAISANADAALHLSSVLPMSMQEEISHCAAGTRWLTYLFNQANGQEPDTTAAADSALDPHTFSDVQSWFHALVRQHFKGDLKVCRLLCCAATFAFRLHLRLSIISLLLLLLLLHTYGNPRQCSADTAEQRRVVTAFMLCHQSEYVLPCAASF